MVAWQNLSVRKRGCSVTVSRNHSNTRRRALLTWAGVAYLVLLTWVVLWKLEVPWIGEAAGLQRPLKLVPFAASGDAGASAPAEVVINLVIFVPYGLFIGALAPAWAWWKAAGVFLGTSLVLESAQHLISTGSFDTTDLIVNTAGGLIGYGIFAALRRRLGDRAQVIMARVCVIVTAIALAAVVAFVASPLHYGPQRDVIVQRSTSQG
jgi:glycopeptide antibiotics resistance protein